MPSPNGQIEHWSLDRLFPYAANARTHSNEQVAQIAASIAAYGFIVPALVDEQGVLIAGHGRLLAARKLGLGSVPVIRLDHLSEAQARAFRLADNQIALNAGWDDALLAAELAQLKDEGLDLDLLGFGEDELDRLLVGLDGAPQRSGEDEVPDTPAEPVTLPGDLWVLGRHNLLCGDCTSAADILCLLDRRTPHLMVTDPPYGVSYDPAWRNVAGVSATERTGKVSNDDRFDWREAWVQFPGDVAYVWHAGVHAKAVAESLEATGFDIRSQIIWSKPRLVLGRGDYHWQHEPCFYAVRKGATGHWQGARDQTTVWTIGSESAGEDAATVHGTQKPVECMRRPILNNSARGDVVYEPFCGSGSTIIAAETTERACLAIEIDPAYCDVAVERWRRFTGLEPVEERTGLSFSDLRAERPGRAA